MTTRVIALVGIPAVTFVNATPKLRDTCTCPSLVPT
jgi:hypothetical protein